MNPQAIWTEEYDVTSFLVDFRKRLSLPGLLNLLQESAWRHAAHLGHGYEETRSVGTSWVLFRQLLQMDAWPAWEDRLSIRTWLRPPTTVVVTRDFELSVGGQAVGQAAAHWLTIDHQTRRPSPLPFTKDGSLFRQDGHLTIEPKKLQVSQELQKLTDFQVRTSDLDMNGHVNNTRFAQWVLDSLPLEAHKAHRGASPRQDRDQNPRGSNRPFLSRPSCRRRQASLRGQDRGREIMTAIRDRICPGFPVHTGARGERHKTK